MEKKRYRNVLKITHDMLNNSLPLEEVELRSIEKCIYQALRDGYKNFQVSSIYIDTTKEIPDKYISDYIFYIHYLHLREEGMNEITIDVLCW